MPTEKPITCSQETLEEFMMWYEHYTPYGIRCAQEWTPPNCGWTPEDFYREAWLARVCYTASWWRPDGGKSVRTTVFESIRPLIRRLRGKIDIRSAKASPSANFGDFSDGVLDIRMDPETPVDCAVHNEELNLLRDKLCWAMQHSPPFFRDVVELRLQGKLYREIADVLGVSRQRVDQLWHRFIRFGQEENRINPAPKDFHQKFRPEEAWQGTGISCRKKCALCGEMLPPKNTSKGNSRKYCGRCLSFTLSTREKLMNFKKRKESEGG